MSCHCFCSVTSLVTRRRTDATMASSSAFEDDRLEPDTAFEWVEGNVWVCTADFSATSRLRSIFWIATYSSFLLFWGGCGTVYLWSRVNFCSKAEWDGVCPWSAHYFLPQAKKYFGSQDEWDAGVCPWSTYFFGAPMHSKVSVLCWIWSNTIMCLGLGQKNFDIIAKKLVSPYKIAASPILQTKCLVYFDK